MPLPFILAGAAVAAAGYGAYKGKEAYDTNKEAQRIDRSARRIYREAEESLKKAKESTQEKVEALGKEKVKIYTTSVTRFVTLFGQLKHVEIEAPEGDESSWNEPVSDAELQEMREVSLKMEEVAAGGFGALGAGGLTGLAVYGGVGVLGTASTGTAIGTLSGAAATNATLAWLGGGSLASGGLGIAGGTAVLGGLVAGPAILVGGIYMSEKAKEAAEQAKENRAKAELAAEEMKTAEVAVKGLGRKFDSYRKMLKKLDLRFESALDDLEQVVAREVDYKKLDRSGKEVVYMSAQLAKLVKGALEVKLLDDNGKVTVEAKEFMKLVQA